mmetsp:Transcript_109273/g.308308  ORF Transcript_109273/g.308308 Transcript_109273/m.308308 type:complete len:486 (+) Transcript_109273:552-2009(+)
MRGVVKDVAVTVFLAIALRAGAPFTPVTPFAVDAVVRAWALPGVASSHLLQRGLALLALELRQRDDFARARLLTSAARTTAFGPRLPVAEHAIDVHELRRAPIRALIARSNLGQWPDAKLPRANARRHDAAAPLLRAVTSAAAAAPGRPLGKFTIDFVLRARFVLVAELRLLREALRRVAAFIPRGHHPSVAPSHALRARRRAILPLRPGPPLAVDASGAGLRVAGLDFALVQRVAELPKAKRRHRDVAVPGPRAAAARARAATPLLPVAPFAINVLGARFQARAGPNHLEGAGEPRAARVAVLDDARAGLLASVAIGVAPRPLAPLKDLSFVDVHVTGHGLGGAVVTGFTAFGRQRLDRTTPVLLRRLSVALAPRRPLAELAVDHIRSVVFADCTARLGLHEGARTRLPTFIVTPGNAPVAHADAGAIAIAPLGPFSELAIHGLAIGARRVVGAKLPNFVLARARAFRRDGEGARQPGPQGCQT